MRRTEIPAIITAILLAILVLAPVCGAAPEGAVVVKVGDITSFGGAVFVRTKGVWGRLRKAPHPIFSSDKIVTKQGRAQVGFVDGGRMRVNVDSNITIVQNVSMKGMFAKKRVVSREVKVLVGTVWFDVKVRKNDKLTFRTPSMTAAIRGTSGQAGSDKEGKGIFGLTSGKAEVSGD